MLQMLSLPSGCHPSLVYQAPRCGSRLPLRKLSTPSCRNSGRCHRNGKTLQPSDMNKNSPPMLTWQSPVPYPFHFSPFHAPNIYWVCPEAPGAACVHFVHYQISTTQTVLATQQVLPQFINEQMNRNLQLITFKQW